MLQKVGDPMEGYRHSMHSYSNIVCELSKKSPHFVQFRMQMPQNTCNSWEDSWGGIERAWKTIMARRRTTAIAVLKKGF